MAALSPLPAFACGYAGGRGVMTHFLSAVILAAMAREAFEFG